MIFHVIHLENPELQNKIMNRIVTFVLQTFDEELDKERKMRASAERDLTEAAQRLKMAHDEIRKLTDDLLIKKKELSELGEFSRPRACMGFSFLLGRGHTVRPPMGTQVYR